MVYECSPTSWKTELKSELLTQNSRNLFLQILFTEFVDWALEKNLDIEDDVEPEAAEEAPEEAAEEKTAEETAAE